MSFYEQDGCSWRHVSFSSMLDRRQAILLLDYMRSMVVDAPVKRDGIAMRDMQPRFMDPHEH